MSLPVAGAGQISQNELSRSRETFVPKAEQGDTEFYVVGGPVHPDRPCYVVRPSDEELYGHLLRDQCCYVLSSRQCGKSSLMARTVSRLRAERRLAAVVDLSQIGSREYPDDSGRWYYGVAYRILRELKIKLDLQTWWQDKDSLNTFQRLLEFFREVVLGNTSAPVTIFFDEVDRTLDLSFAADFYASLRACYDARATEPEFSRLTFVLLGVASPRQLAPDQSHAPFNIFHRIDLSDFSLQEAANLTRGMYLSEDASSRALRRIFYWSGGQPYLTQKLCRMVARHGLLADVEKDVDNLVAERFLAPKASANEPNLSQVRSYLERKGRSNAQALKFYRKIRRGRRVFDDPVSPNLAILKLSGLVTKRRGRSLVVRNRIYARVFDLRWVAHALPLNWRPLLRNLAVITTLVAAIVWYTNVLPRPYIKTLSRVTDEHELAFEAYQSLRRIPGFGSKADELFAGVQMRRSLGAATYVQVRDADMQLRQLDGFEIRADELMAEFWDRLALAAEAIEQRDIALLGHLNALRVPTEGRRRNAAHLIGADYERLLATLRPGGSLDRQAITDSGATVVTVSDGNKLRRWSDDAGWNLAGVPMSVTAGEFVSVRRHATFDSQANAFDVRLELAVRHHRVGDLLVSLTAPSGREIRLSMPTVSGDGRRAIFSSRNEPTMAMLSGEALNGGWTLTIEDQVPDITGELLAWRLIGRSNTEPFSEEFGNALGIPDPRETEQVEVILSPDGRYAAAVDRNPSVRGYIAVWDTGTATRSARIYKEPEPTFVVFDRASQYLLTMPQESGHHIDIWLPSTGQHVGSLRAWQRFEGTPSLSADGRRLVVTDTRTDGQLAARIFDIPTASAITNVILPATPLATVINSDGSRLVVADRTGDVSFWTTAQGGRRSTLAHPLPVEAIRISASDQWLATLDQAGVLRIWDIGAEIATEPVFTHPVTVAYLPEFSADGRGLLLQPTSGAFEIRTLPDGQRVGPRLRHSQANRLRRLGVRPEENFVLQAGFLDLASGRAITRGDTGSLRVWQLTGADLEDVAAASDNENNGDLSRVLAADLSADGRHIVLSRSSGNIEIVSLSDSNAAVVVAGSSGYTTPGIGPLIQTLAVSPDSNILLGGGRDGSVRFWDMNSGVELESVMQFGGGGISAAAFSTDATTIMTADAFGAHLWQRETTSVSHSFGTSAPVLSVAVASGNGIVGAGTRDGEIHLWDSESGDTLVTFSLNEPVTALAFSEDGQFLAAGSRAGAVQVWNLSRLESEPEVARVASRIVELSFCDGSKAVIVQTDHWLHRVYREPDRLRRDVSRMLEGSVPAGAWRLLSDSCDRIRIATIDNQELALIRTLELNASDAIPVQGDPATLLSTWRQKLQLRFDDDGQ